MPQTASIS